LRLAGILGESLRGVLYVLDEPSQGLHPSELRDLTVTLRRLCDQGNTLLLVDHDEIVMRAADWIVDLGPGGGAEGGQLMARFRPKDAADWRNQSATARMLSDPPAHLRVEVATREPSAFITIKKPTIHHLKMPVARFAKGAFNVVTGVSGAGKSSLAVDTLYGNALRLKTLGEGAHLHCDAIAGLEGITDIELVDRRPVAKSSVSMPATYLDVFTDLRNLFAKLPEAQVAGMTPRTFSLHAEGGRCEECRGRGEILLQMKFLSDARVPCPRCKGLRYRSNVLDVRFAGLNFSDVLRLTIAEAARHFARHRRIIERLQPAIDLGLGYLKMGQPSASLSGGEAQRLKLVPYLTRPRGHQSLMVIDEPTTGLHREDVARLVVALRRLADQGVTLVVVEHHEAIIHAADWQLDVGPGAADAGGQLVYEGRPREV
jgi:excinuclease ABC subunit A